MWNLSQKHAFKAFEYQVEAQECVLENPEFLMSARAGEDMLKREIRAPSIFADMDVCSSGEPCREAFCSSARVRDRA